MTQDYFIVESGTPARQALRKLEIQGMSGSVLFVLDATEKVIGSLTDGDIRRGLLKNLEIDDRVDEYMNTHFRHVTEGELSKEVIKDLKQKKITYVPVIDDNGTLLRVLDVAAVRSALPLHALIMAGGKGERLRPLTLETPKPMLIVGDKPIIEHNIDRLISFGIQRITISVCYLKEVIMEYFGDGSSKGIRIDYVTEDAPLGTLGAITLVSDIRHDDILVMNSDILTNLDFDDFYTSYRDQAADMIVATTPYTVNIPFAVMQLTKENEVTGFYEKPRYTYYSNAGIYIFKRKFVDVIPRQRFYNATDLMQMLLEQKYKLTSEPILGYWLDVGRFDDYKKAQEDIKHLSL